MPLPVVQHRTPLDPASLGAGPIQGLYVHVPFCFHKCHYCDFYSITGQSPQRMEAFVDRILREADLWVCATRSTLAPRTVFFGGGTPSLLPATTMKRLLAGLRARFDLSRVGEWTIEINPATASLDYCRMLLDSGVNRVSFGAQSFNAHELALLERHHHPDDVARSIEWARQAGFERMNIDLIYAIPGQTLDSWACSLEQAIALNLTHISCYNLTFEPNTPLAVRLRLGQFSATTEETELAMFHHARARLGQAGLLPYEISNYATPGQECQHNLVYWTGGNYLGLGPSGASHLSGTRFKNRPHLGEWEQGIDQGLLAVIDVERLSPRRRAGEMVMLQLRLQQGVVFDEFAARTGLDARQLFAQQLQRLERAGLIQTDNRRFGLTDRGLAVADAVAGEFL